jgi:hypothetical protein
MEDAIEGSFADWVSGESARVDRSSPISARQIQLIDRPGAKQSTILMGLPLRAITTPGYSDLSQANAILGGWLTLSPRPKFARREGLDVRCTDSARASSERQPLDASRGREHARHAPALREIFRELSRLSGEPLDPRELRQGPELTEPGTSSWARPVAKD